MRYGPTQSSLSIPAYTTVTKWSILLPLAVHTCLGLWGFCSMGIFVPLTIWYCLNFDIWQGECPHITSTEQPPAPHCWRSSGVPWGILGPLLFHIMFIWNLKFFLKILWGCWLNCIYLWVNSHMSTFKIKMFGCLKENKFFVKKKSSQNQPIQEF